MRAVWHQEHTARCLERFMTLQRKFHRAEDRSEKEGIYMKITQLARELKEGGVQIPVEVGSGEAREVLGTR